MFSLKLSHVHLVAHVGDIKAFPLTWETRLRAGHIFPLEFVEPRKDIAKTGARKPGQGKTREARKIGTADNPLFKTKPLTFIAMSQSGHVQ